MASDILLIEPGVEVVFDKRKTGESMPTSILKLTNTSHALDVLFRVQTTSPATYRVRPSHGRIMAGASQDVQIVMVTESTKADKFLVKYVTVSRSLPVGDFSKQFAEASATSHEHRLRVLILTEGMSTPPVATSPIDATSPTSAPRANSPSSEAPTGPLARTASQLTTFNDPIARSSSIGEKVSDINKRESTAPSGELSRDQLILELRDARLKIVELQRALDEKSTQVVRLRRESSAAAEANTNKTTGLGPGISQEELKNLLDAQAGFPPILVLLIALFAFLVGLLF